MRILQLCRGYCDGSATYSVYRKPPNISPGLIQVRKLFWGGLIHGGGLIHRWAYTWKTIATY